jgi:hypothetical protein
MPHGFRGWASWFAAQAALTFVWHWILKLPEHAILTWVDDQIASLLGFSAPQASTVISWAIPAFLGAATLFLYHLTQTKASKTAITAWLPSFRPWLRARCRARQNRSRPSASVLRWEPAITINALSILLKMV